MLTDLTFLEINKPVIPADSEEQERISRYKLNFQLYNGKFKQAFADTIRKLNQRYPTEKMVTQQLIKLNFFKLITDFNLFLLLNQPVKVTVDESRQAIFDEIDELEQFQNTVKEVAKDVSRYGNGIFKVRLEDGNVKIESLPPLFWFPVVDSCNIKKVMQYVLMYCFTKNIAGKKQDFLRVELHNKGYIENRLYLVKDSKIIRQLELPYQFSEGDLLDLQEKDDFSDKWDDFLIFPVSNSHESDSFYSLDDYSDLIEIIEALMLTISQESKMINRYADPKLLMDAASVERDMYTGEQKVKDSDVLVITDREAVKPEFLSPHLEFQAVKSHIDNLMNMFHYVSKIPKEAIGEGAARNVSGSALEKMFLLAVARVRDLVSCSYNPVLKQLVRCVMAMNGTPVESLSIEIKAGIPVDKQEVSDRTINEHREGLMSTRQAVKAVQPELSGELLDAEIEEISKDKQLTSFDQITGVHTHDDQDKIDDQ